MDVLIAPDHFGGTLSAREAASALARGWLAAGHQALLRPMSDGATDLSEAVHEARGGTLLAVDTQGALAERVAATVLHLDVAGSAYIETGQVLGVTDLEDPDAAERAVGGSSAGVADLLLAAITAGARRIVIGAGASATHDAGAGLWCRLAELLNIPVSAEEPWLALADLRQRLREVDLVVAAATGQPLTGLHGAAAALSRFTEISAQTAQELERRTGEFTSRAQRHAQSLPPIRPVLNAPTPATMARSDYAGAGGGLAFALGLLGARVLPGAQVVAQEIGIAQAVTEVDLVVTGSAAMDVHAMHDGVIATVGRLAAAEGLPAVAIAHEVHVNRRELAEVGISAAYPVRDRPSRPSGELPRSDERAALAERGQRLVRNWAR